jgi:CRISPR-associated endonuclease/helicase Cas3
MRPFDLHTLVKDRPDLLTVKGDSGVDVLIATQTLEVGVDLDLAALVTELAPASALAQRAGRVNRLGHAGTTEIVVIGPAPDSELLAGRPVDGGKETRTLVVAPYADKGDTERYRHLDDTWTWLTRREPDPAGMSPLALAGSPPPPEPGSRMLWQRLEMSDAWLLSRSGNQLFDEPDLELWLRDLLDEDHDSGGLVVRGELPDDESSALALLKATPPVDGETYPTTLRDLRAVVDAVLNTAATRRRAFVFRNGEIGPLENTIRPGDVVIVDDNHLVCRSAIVTATPTQRSVDVYDHVAEWTCRLVGEPASLLDDFADLLSATDNDPDDEDITSFLDDNRGRVDRLDRIVERLAEPTSKAASKPELTYAWSGFDDSATRWLVVSTPPPNSLDDAARQLRTPARAPVLLDDHSAAVGARARDIAERLGLHPAIRVALTDAGLGHDLGKRDERFQRIRLGNQHPDRQLLAKNRTSTRRARIAESLGGLPTRWRHEQLSAALVAAEHQESPHRELVLRLVGTSHGHGRPEFPHLSSDLLTSSATSPVRDAARALFDTGEWDALIESTHTKFGIWGCAYLEAVLRAADGQVSGEGR